MPPQNSPGILDNDDLDHAANLLNDERENPADSLLFQPSWKASKTSDDDPSSGFANIKSWLWPERTSRPKNLHKTAYLDGLRGVAAFLVYWHHHTLWVNTENRTNLNQAFENAFGYQDKYYFAALPGIRLFFSGGHFAVATFFVLSGYVLSIKAWKLIESDEVAALAEHLASALFRRWLRLYLPIIGIVIIYGTLWHFPGIWVAHAESQRNWFDEMWWLYCEFKNFSFVFKEGGVPWLTYNPHVWSIPVEFKGSVVVFATLLSLSRSTLTARLLCQIALMFYFMYIADGWYCAAFIGGMFLCHLDLLASQDRLPRIITRFKPYKTAIFYHMLVIAIYLGGIPCEDTEVSQLVKNRGWYYLSFLKPQAVFDYKWFYLFWAAMFLVTAVTNIGWLKRFFEMRFCQYLGRICYGLYLVHGPVIWLLGDRLYAAVGYYAQSHVDNIPHWVNRFPLPRVGPLGLQVSFLLPNIILLPLTLYAADVVTRVFDKPSANLASRLYKMTLPASPAKQSRA